LNRLGSAVQRVPVSLVTAIEGDSDRYDTHASLVENCSAAASSLGLRAGAGEGGRKAGGCRYVGMLCASVARRKGFWLTILFLFGVILLALSQHGDPLLRDPDRDAFFDVNDPTSAFVGVTGLVYALVFASAFQEAQNRFDEIRRSLVQEANGVHTAMLLVRTLTCDNAVHKMRTLVLFGHYIQMLSKDITSREYES
jgi:hypothetical protein